MEKYSQFRDKGTGIAPFLPVPSTAAGIYLPLRAFLFVIRLPILLFVTLAYFFVFCWLPIGSLGKKAALWLMLAVPGIWWVDLQVDGVRRGSLGSKSAMSRLPRPSSVIVSSTASPIDAIYLAAIFDPVFTISYPNSRLLQRTTLFHSIIRALLPPQLHPPPSATSRGSKDGRNSLVTLAELTRAHPKRVICVLPECTTTNGRGILPLSPCLLTASKETKIFPASVRYNPPDVTTPVPGWSEAVRFFWNLCSSPTHTIRVRVAEAVYNTSLPRDSKLGLRNGQADHAVYIGDEGDEDDSDTDDFTDEEKRVLDKVGEALARLGRVKRVGLGLKDKIEFIKTWNRRRR